MESKYILELEDISDELSQLANMTIALYSAMFESGDTSENYGPSMYCLSRLLRKLDEKMQNFYERIEAACKPDIEGGSL